MFIIPQNRQKVKSCIMDTRMLEYQTYEDGCRIYGESELLKAIRETEEEIMSLQSVSCCN